MDPLYGGPVLAVVQKICPVLLRRVGENVPCVIGV